MSRTIRPARPALSALTLPALTLPTLSCLALSLLAATPAPAADPIAKQAFGGVAAPSSARPQAVGFYSKGCIAGAAGMPVDGQTWQVMRLSRNRRWGHPELVGLLQQLSIKAREVGWNGLLVGDMSQPRGGPMLTGHASHQSGLDADIWLTPMPDRRLSLEERESLSATDMLGRRSVYVNEAVWTPAHGRLLREAALIPQVERLLVHPGIKKKLCDTAGADNAWLAKVRPYWGHNYHFHLRIGCPVGSPDCKPQQEVAGGIGCDLDWWFDVGLKPPKEPAKPTPPKPPLRVSQMPAACAPVLEAPAKPPEARDLDVTGTAMVSSVALPRFDPQAAARSAPIEAAGGGPVPAATPAVTPAPAPTPAPTAPSGETGALPVPTPRPVR